MSHWRCLICHAELEAVDADAPLFQPHNGLIFEAFGNYGSRVHDPVGASERLRIVICDACVLVAASFGDVVKYEMERYRPVVKNVRAFDAERGAS